jgi:hypothetical protein
MTLPSVLGRAVAVAIVVAGIALFTFALDGVRGVDTRLELAAAQQQAAPALVDCPFREHRRDREPV